MKSRVWQRRRLRIVSVFMKRILIVFAASLILALTGFAQDIRLGIYLAGQKIGSSTYSVRAEILDGKELSRSDVLTVFDSQMLGEALKIRAESTTWSDSKGNPVRMSFRIESGGRAQNILANFSKQSIQVNIDNNGNKSEKTLEIPAGAKIVDDPTMWVMKDAGPSKREFYVFDPTLVTLIKTTAESKGKAKVRINEKNFDATLIEVIDPRATTQVYLSAKGDLIKATGPMGIEMIPEGLLGSDDKTESGTIDLASATSIPLSGTLAKAAKSKTLLLEVQGLDLKKLASDDHQTVNIAKNTVEIHPVRWSQVKVIDLAAASKSQTSWLKPALHVPADDAEMKKLAASIVGDTRDAAGAAKKIRAWVYQQMRPNAGIGVLRDAREILATKEGVCRDYAILTATLLRAAGIPTRLCSGLLHYGGAFYYHAWVECFLGGRWYALDSTLEHDQVGADHLKLRNGSVEDALTFPILTGAKLKLIKAGY